MSGLVIIGASAMGREACAYARDIGMVVRGFLDSRTDILDGFDGYPPILCSAEEYVPKKGDLFVCAIGDCAQRRRYVDAIAAKGGRFTSVVHPSAYIGRNSSVGEGSIVCPNVTITTDVSIGCHVVVNVSATVSHDCRIGDFSTLCPGANLAGRVSVASGVFVGTGAVVIPDMVVEASSTVGAGAVVIDKVLAGDTVAGNPARVLIGRRGVDAF